jgi:hypothetical protein
MKSLEKEISMAFPTRSRLLVLMTDEEIEKNRELILDNFKLVLDNSISLLSTNLPKYPAYDRHKIHIYHIRNSRFVFRVSDVDGIRRWELYPSAIKNQDSNGILFLYATRNNTLPCIDKEHGSIVCDFEAFLSEAILAELVSQYDVDTFIDSCKSSYYKKRISWILRTYFRNAFPFNVELPKWLVE